MECFQVSWKNMALLLVALSSMIVVNLPQVDADAVPWNYHMGQFGGPDKWYLNYSDCGGLMQSPIEIDTDHVLYDEDLELFDLSDYAKTEGVQLTLVNKGGHTAEVLFSGTPLYLKGGSLPSKYKLDQYHFHWGAEDARGSEHGLNGKHFPMELHLVHHQDRLNGSVAPEHPHGLAVLGFFFKVGAHNDKYDKLLKHFANITAADQSVSIPTFPLSDLLPVKVGERLDYYRYAGSLTTPPCYETVIWSIATEYVEISEDQLDMFRDLRDAENEDLVDDFRPVQLLNHRRVTATKVPDERDSGDFLTASKLVVLFGALVCVFIRQF